MLVFTVNEAFAGETTQRMIYDVYAGGFRVVQAKLVIDYSKKDRYDLSLDAGTYGFLGKLAPWHGTYTTTGWVMDDKRQPEKHQSVASWRDEVETHTYNYAKDGNFKTYVIQEEGKPKEIQEPDLELTNNTLDLLSSTLLIMENVASGGLCEGTSEIFDGKRRFQKVFRDQGETLLNASRYNIYGGPARECTVEVIPVAGKWRDKPRGWMSIQEQGRERGMMPTLWMASISDGVPAVPVKIRVKTAYGTMFMHLAEYQYGDKFLIAEKRKD
ncbi:MAG: DUF3108 domain-containing protein [Alphaproteobacteria bacterium]